MKITINRTKLSPFVKKFGSDHACLLGQVLQQRDAKAYQAAGQLMGVDDARSVGLINKDERHILAGIYKLSADVQYGLRSDSWLERLKKFFPNDEFEIIDGEAEFKGV